MTVADLTSARSIPARQMQAASVGARLAKLLRSGVALGLLTSAGLVLWVFFGLHGLEYYTTPLGVRGYTGMHKLLRPSGPIGQSFGVFGALMMLVPFFYMIRKRIRARWLGSPRVWLEVHLYCGIVGPVMVTLHTTFKFNGIVSAAYWSMMIVMTSGFVGRYLYVRIPKTIRGTELSHAELDKQAAALLDELTEAVGPGPWLDRVQALERAAVPARSPSFAGLLFGEARIWWRIRALARDIRRSDLPMHRRDELVAIVRERTLILRRVAYLQKTKAAFGLWHVFHLPLVYLMLVIVSLHVAVALYLGYVPFRW